MVKEMVSAVCIDWLKKEILLIWNTDPEKPLGFWGLPGGKMKENETPEEGAVRELFQETNQENGKLTKYKIEIPKIGPYGDYTHHFIAVKIISTEKELKNYEDTMAIPKWVSLQEIISGRIRMFRGHIQGLILLLERMAEKTPSKDKIDKHGIKILSEIPPYLSETLNELKSVFNEKGQYIRPYPRRKA